MALLVAGGVGLVASFVLSVERYRLLVDPGYVPSCSLNPVLSCGSVMGSPQAQAFGFPNSLLGLVGFTVLLVVGAVLAGGSPLPGGLWLGLQVGVTAGVVFVHWLIAVSLDRIGALCPYCMAVWAVTIPTFTAVTLRNAGAVVHRLSPVTARVVAVARRREPVLLTAWFLMVAALITERFWTYWSTLVG